jgi:uncharacterized protein Yka (UPF0111/DUF47 family)
VVLRVPYDRGDIVSLLHEAGSVETTAHDDAGFIIMAKIPLTLMARFEAFISE